MIATTSKGQSNTKFASLAIIAAIMLMLLVGQATALGQVNSTNTNLTIWDSTENIVGWLYNGSVNETDLVSFYANYTNVTSGDYMNSSCTFMVNSTVTAMEYNASTELSWLNTSFATPGYYNYTVWCNASGVNQSQSANLSVTDLISIDHQNTTYVVNITSAGFEPNETSIWINDTVSFVNLLNETHAVASGWFNSSIGKFASGALAGNQSYNVTFLDRAVFAIFDSFVSNNSGVIRVTGGVDTNTPTVTWLDPSNESLLDKTVSAQNITFRSDENVTCRASETDASFAWASGVTLNTSDNYYHTYDYGNMSNNNTYNLYVTCRDVYANEFNLSGYVNTTNNTRPNIAIYSPLNNTVFNDTHNVTIIINVTDPEEYNTSCDLYVDGTWNQTNTSVNNATNTSFTIVGLSQTNHSWYINCQDTAFTNGTTGTAWFESRNHPPALGYGAGVANNASILTDFVYLNISSDQMLGGIQVDWNGTNTTLTSAGLYGGVWYYGVNMTHLTNATNYTFRVYANDTDSLSSVLDRRWVYANFTLDVNMSYGSNLTVDNATYANYTINLTNLGSAHDNISVVVASATAGATAVFNASNVTDVGPQRWKLLSFVVNSSVPNNYTHGINVSSMKNTSIWKIVNITTTINPVDTTGPNITQWSPLNSSWIDMSITAQELSIVTDENATCAGNETTGNFSYPNGTMLNSSDNLNHTYYFANVSVLNNYTLYVSCADVLNNTANLTAAFTVSNTTLPTINASFPTNGYTLNDTTNMTFIFNVTDPQENETSCDLYVDGIWRTTNATVHNATTTEFSVSSLNLTNHTWYINCQDTANTRSLTPTLNFTLVDTVPAVGFGGGVPTNGTIVVDYVYANMTSDQLLDTAWVDFNGTNYTMSYINMSGSRYVYAYNVTNLDNNTNYTFRMYANDSTNNNASLPARIVLTNYSVNFSLSYGTSATTYNNSQANYTITVTNNGSVADNFTFTIANASGASTESFNVTTVTDVSPGASRNVTLTIADVDVGNYTTRFNVSSGRFPGLYIVSSNITTEIQEAPLFRVTLSTPQNFTVNESEVATFNITVTNSGLQNTTYNITVRNVTNVTTFTINDTQTTLMTNGTTYQVQATMADPTPGTYVVEVNATSVNESSAYDSQPISITVSDTTPPNITVTSSDSNSSFKRNWSFINVTITGTPSAQWIIYNGTNYTLTQGTPTTSYTRNLTSMFIGNNTLDIYARDAAGNMQTIRNAWLHVNWTRRDVRGTPARNITSIPDSTEIYYLYLMNHGNTRETISLSGRKVTANLTSLTYPTVNVTLSPGQAQNVSFTVRTNGVGNYSFVTHYNYSNISKEADYNLDARTPIIYDIQLSASGGTTKTVPEGTDASFVVTVRNLGSRTESLAIGVDNPSSIRTLTVLPTLITSLAPSGSTTTSVVANDIMPGTYPLTVRATPDSNASAAGSIPLTVVVSNTLPPSAISNLGAKSIGHDRITWNWTNPVDLDFSSAEILINDILAGSTGTNEYTAQNLNPETSYKISVRALDSGGLASSFVEFNSVTDEAPPVVHIANVTPAVVISGEEVSFYTNASNYNTLYADITYPDGSVNRVTLTNDDTTELEVLAVGTYTARFIANRTDLVDTEIRTFDVREKIVFQPTTTAVGGTGLDTNVTIYYKDEIFTTAKADSGTFTPIDIGQNKYDVEFTAYEGEVEVRFADVDIGVNRNASVSMDKSDDPDYVVVYGFKSNFVFHEAALKLSYQGRNFTNEDKLAVYRCGSWDFESRFCKDNDWTKMPVHSQNKNEDYVITKISKFSSYAIKQEPYCGDRKVDDGEECDGGEQCSESCKIIPIVVQQPEPEPETPVQDTTTPDGTTDSTEDENQGAEDDQEKDPEVQTPGTLPPAEDDDLAMLFFGLFIGMMMTVLVVGILYKLEIIKSPIIDQIVKHIIYDGIQAGYYNSSRNMCKSPGMIAFATGVDNLCQKMKLPMKKTLVQKMEDKVAKINEIHPDYGELTSHQYQMLEQHVIAELENRASRSVESIKRGMVYQGFHHEDINKIVSKYKLKHGVKNVPQQEPKKVAPQHETHVQSFVEDQMIMTTAENIEKMRAELKAKGFSDADITRALQKYGQVHKEPVPKEHGKLDAAGQQKLRTFVFAELDRGVREDQLLVALLKQGFSKTSIDNAFREWHIERDQGAVAGIQRGAKHAASGSKGALSRLTGLVKSKIGKKEKLPEPQPPAQASNSDLPNQPNQVNQTGQNTTEGAVPPVGAAQPGQVAQTQPAATPDGGVSAQAQQQPAQQVQGQPVPQQAGQPMQQAGQQPVGQPVQQVPQQQIAGAPQTEAPQGETPPGEGGPEKVNTDQMKQDILLRMKKMAEQGTTDGAPEQTDGSEPSQQAGQDGNGDQTQQQNVN